MKSFRQFINIVNEDGTSAAGVPANAIGSGSNVQPLTGDPIGKKRRLKVVKRKASPDK